MATITRDSLMTLEAYAKARHDFRAQVMAHKKDRIVHLGEHVTLIFEDELTMRYQVQEMLRAEKMFEEEGIQDELSAYNPMIPDGNNWKATMMIEYTDLDERRRMLENLIGVEDKVWVRAGDLNKVYAIADEDLERENAQKTSAVHFLRFELSQKIIGSLKRGSKLTIGVDHPAYSVSLDAIPSNIQTSLLRDLAG